MQENKQRISASVDKEAYSKASDVFNQLGMSTSTGIAIYLKRVAETGSIPFNLTTKSEDQNND